MSEEKLYAVKNDEGKYWEFFDNSGFWTLDISDSPITPSKYQAEQVANEHGGHVVTLVEEPEKVAVSPNEAQAIESLLNPSGSKVTFNSMRHAASVIGTSTGFISDALHHARQHKTCKGWKLLEVTDDDE